MGRATAVRKLEEFLRSLKNQYEAAPPVVDEGEQHERTRRAAQASLIAVVEFMAEMPDWFGLDFGLIHLVKALNNIEAGIGEAWLENHAPHGHSRKIEILLVRGKCAAIMSLLMDGGRSRKDAATMLHRGLSKRARENLKITTWKTIDNWRNAVIGAADDTPQRAGYESILAAGLTDIEGSLKPLLKGLSRVVE